MASSVLFPATFDDTLPVHLTAAKSLSTDADEGDADDGNGGDGDDDNTIQYDNTTLNVTQRLQQQQRQQRLLLEDQRTLQTSPSSVVPLEPAVEVPRMISCSNSTNNNNSNNNSKINNWNNRIVSATATALSIPTLHGLSHSATSTSSTTLTSGTTSTTIATGSTGVIQKPFFIMDFLEDIDPQTLALVQQTLLQQQHHHHLDHQHQVPSSERPTNVEDMLCANVTASLSLHNETHDDGENEDEDHATISNHGIPVPNHSLTATSSSPFLQRSIEIGAQFHHRGMVAAQSGEWNGALRYWLDALEIRSQILTSPHHHHNNNLDIADTYNNIGIAYGKLEQYDYALQYLNKALEIRIDSVAAMLDDNTNTTPTFTSTTTPSLPQSLPQQLHRDIAASLYGIGTIYQKQNELSMAIQYFIKCKLVQEELSVSCRRRMDMARTCIAIGHTYAMGQAYSDAYDAFYDAIVIMNLDDTNTGNSNKNHKYFSEYQSTVTHLRMMEQMK